MRRILILLALLLVVSCTKQSNNSSSQNIKKLVIISPHPREILNEFDIAFKAYYEQKHNEEIDIEWLDMGGTSDGLKFIRSEFSKKTDGIDVDIFWGGGTTPYLTLKNENLLEPLNDIDKNIISKIPRTISGIPIYDKEMKWFGGALSSFGFICNKYLLDKKNYKAPRSWDSLGDPKLLGVVGSADPRHSGSTHTIYSIILQAYGWEKGWDVITRMGANVRQFIRSSKKILKEVETGDVMCALCIDFYAWSKINELGKDKMSFTMPEGLTILNADAMGVLKGAPNRELAKSFVEFVLSESGQRLWLLPAGAAGGPKKKTLGRLSVMPSLYKKVKGQSVVPLNPFELKGYIVYNESEADALWTLVSDMVGTLVIDSKSKLRNRWEKIVKKGMHREALKELGKVPFDKTTALSYAKKWRNEVFRNRKINEWLSFNEKKFKKIDKLTR